MNTFSTCWKALHKSSWCNPLHDKCFRSTQVVSNLLLFARQSIKFHFLTQFSANFGQEGLKSAVLGASYYEEKFRIFLWKSQKFLAKRSFGSRILGRTQFWREQILVSYETRFLFFNNFQILDASSITIEDLWKNFDF